METKPSDTGISVIETDLEVRFDQSVFCDLNHLV